MPANNFLHSALWKYLINMHEQLIIVKFTTKVSNGCSKNLKKNRNSENKTENVLKI